MSKQHVGGYRSFETDRSPRPSDNGRKITSQIVRPTKNGRSLIFENGIGRLLTVTDVANLLQCSVGTIRNLVWKGKIPTVRPTPAMVRFHPEEIWKWLSERNNV